MKELGDNSRRALDAYREALTPGASDADANRAAIAQRVAAGELPMELPEEPAATADDRRAPALAWIGAAVAVAAAAVAVVGVGTRELSQRPDTDTAAAAPYEAPASTSVGGAAVEREVPRAANPPTAAAAPAVPQTPIADPVPRQAEAPAPTPRKPRTRPGPSTPRTAPAPAPAVQAAQAAREAALIGRARAALRDDNPRTALLLIEDHARRFPDGELREEAEVVRLAALCDLGRTGEARNGAATFVKRHPGSPLAGHARRICAEAADAG